MSAVCDGRKLEGRQEEEGAGRQEGEREHSTAVHVRGERRVVTEPTTTKRAGVLEKAFHKQKQQVAAPPKNNEIKQHDIYFNDPVCLFVHSTEHAVPIQ